MNEGAFEMPACVIERIAELRELCEANPRTIPIPEAAKFLGMAPDSLRESINTGACPFGLGWQRRAGGNRGFVIPTHLFYLCNYPQYAQKTLIRKRECDDPRPDYLGGMGIV